MNQHVIKPALFVGLAICAAFAAFTFEGKETDPASKPNPTSPGYRWTMLTDNAAFKKNYNFQLFTHDDKLWAFHPDGNYYSTNGKQWSKSSLPNSIHNLAFMDYLYYNNAVFGLGHFEGNSEQFDLTTPITRTTDFNTWVTLAKESNFPKRFFYSSLVFNNKMWVFGGSDGTTEFDDAWSSADGVHWKKEADHLPFGKAVKQSFVVFNKTLYRLDNDVWTSTDGINWKQLTPRIANTVISGYTAVVFDEKIWLLGCSRDGKFASKIMVSADGINWEEQDAPWSPRGGIAATVFNNKLYITGGKYGGFAKGTTVTEFIYSNDVWVLEKTNAQPNN